MARKRVLVVSFFYPPFSSVGATRVSKMTKYLALSGWDSHVITVNVSALPPTLPIEIPETAIDRAPQWFDLAALPRAIVGRRRLEEQGTQPTTGRAASLLGRLGDAYRHLVCFPDGQIGWWPGAVKAGLAAIARVKPDVILSSSLPNTSHLIARSLARKTGLPWVAELRDLWTENHNFRRTAPLRLLERRLERAVLSEASALVTVSEAWAAWLESAYRRPTFTIPNGYDPVDYPPPSPPDRKLFSLVYTGMFYNGKQNPDPLFEAIARLAAAGRIRPGQFRVRFVGRYLGPVLERAAAHRVLPFVEVNPPVSYREALALQRSASALLFLDWADGRRRGWYSAKIYEYLGAGRPVLSLGPHDSVVADLLARVGAGRVASGGAEVAAALDAWLTELETTGTVAYTADEALRQTYDRQHAAAAMAAVLEQVSRGGPVDKAAQGRDV